MSRGGLYLWRTRKPHAVFGLPIIGRHNGYGGMTNSFYHREGQHLRGSATYSKPAASWSDLKPKCWRIPLPDWLFGTEWRREHLVKTLETLLIAVTCPVYNEKQQPPWNFRKISRKQAAMQRKQRDDHGQMMFLARFIVRWVCIIGVLNIAYLIYLRTA